LFTEAALAVALEDGPHLGLILDAKLLAVGALYDVTPLCAPASNVRALVHGSRRCRGTVIIIVVIIVVIISVITIGTVIEDLMDQVILRQAYLLTWCASAVPAIEAVVAQVRAELVPVTITMATVGIKNIPDVVHIFVTILITFVGRVNLKICLAYEVADRTSATSIDDTRLQFQEAWLRTSYDINIGVHGALPNARAEERMKEGKCSHGG